MTLRSILNLAPILITNRESLGGQEDKLFHSDYSSRNFNQNNLLKMISKWPFSTPWSKNDPFEIRSKMPLTGSIRENTQTILYKRTQIDILIQYFLIWAHTDLWQVSNSYNKDQILISWTSFFVSFNQISCPKSDKLIKANQVHYVIIYSLPWFKNIKCGLTIWFLVVDEKEQI